MFKVAEARVLAVNLPFLEVLHYRRIPTVRVGGKIVTSAMRWLITVIFR